MNLFKNFKRDLNSRARFLNSNRKVYYKRVFTVVERRPLLVSTSLLGLLLILIMISSFMSRPKVQIEETSLPTKSVETYVIGESPKITVQAQIEKSGVVKVVALSPGVVQSINVEVGQEVVRGHGLVSMSTNYQGGNAFSVQRQLAHVQYKNALDTYETSNDLISKQKELAEKSDKNSDELRAISNQSLESTRSLIGLNNQTLTTLEAQQAEDEASNIGGINDDAILQTKQLRSQLMSGNNQLENALKNTEYSVSDSNAPAQISNISKDIALKQLEIQEKALKMNKEVSRLSVVLAQINEAIMFPSAPFSGVIERIYVKPGQMVSPGTPLAQIKGDSQSLIAVVLLSREMSMGISKASPSTLRFGDEAYTAVPFYVSEEATDGGLYSAQYSISEKFSSNVSDKGYVTIEIPIDFPSTGSTIPFIPIDSVFQTQDQAFVFIAKDGKALSKRVKIGEVLGRYVEVKEGLSESDQVILNRNVIQGDPIKIVN
ncbi:MAG: Efflux transporter, RND family, MFP subunit [uncultured bacterium]|nr:MAG: Efflux transporter, RND family, MFP subunit [uncultured bacterium]